MSRGRPRTASPSPHNRILELRLARGWTQEELAARIGCSPGHAQRLETGKRQLNDRWLHALARAFGVEPREVLAREGGGPDPVELRAARVVLAMPPEEQELWLRTGEALAAAARRRRA